MNLKWNLQDIFKDNEQFYNEIELIKIAMADIQKDENTELNSDTLLEILKKQLKILIMRSIRY